MKKILSIAEIICSIGLLGTYIMLLILQNTISYEQVAIFEKTPRSSLFTIMEHNHILGYSLIVFGVISAITTAIRLCNAERKEV